MKKGEKKGLGRGLSALLGDIEETAVDVNASAAAASSETGGGSTVTSAPIEKVHPNPDQPRRSFDSGELDELAASIRERGIIQPIIVRPHPTRKGEHEIVAGERRWRAAQRAQLHRVPIVVRDFDDRTVLEVAVIENVQRTDLNAIEEAQGYSKLMESFGYTQEDLAQVIGKSRSHLANMMRLLVLPFEVVELVRKGDLSAGHARALINAPDPVALARRVVSERLSVRQVEQLVRQLASPSAKKAQKKDPAEKDADTRVLEGDLSAAIGMRVTIEHAGDGTGQVRIRYKDLDALDALCQKLVG